MISRSDHPDPAAPDVAAARWLLEAKRQETAGAPCKGATPSCYAKIPQKGFESMRPGRLADLAALGTAPSAQQALQGATNG